jgi:hypothetical protein
MEEPVGLVIYSISSSFGIPDVTTQLLIGALGVFLLAIDFHSKSKGFIKKFTPIGWILVGLFFYLYSAHYVEISDPLLILMTSAALPLGIIVAFWEVKLEGELSESLTWLKGCVVWSMIPYYVVYSIPVFNMTFVHITALSTEVILEYVGLGNFQAAPMRVDTYVG